MSSKTGELWMVSYTNKGIPRKFRVSSPPKGAIFGPGMSHIRWLVFGHADWSDSSQNMIIRLKPAEVDDLLTWAGLREEVTHGDASQ